MKPEESVWDQPIFTVWIHGTKISFGRYCPIGFYDINSLPTNNYLNRCAKRLVERYPSRFSLDTFYALGWSGKLSFSEREKAAHLLYQSIKQVIAEYKQKHWFSSPKIRLITHSHGGNVALNLVKVKDPHDTSFIIDELVLLACPVQTATEEYIKDPMFKRIYSFYSRVDLGQVLDPQGLYPDDGKNKDRPLLSKRCFKHQDNLLQARLKINGGSAYHTEFVEEHVIGVLPTLIDELEECHRDACATFNHPDRIYALHVKV